MVVGWKSLSDGSRLGLVTPAETWHDGRNGRDGREVSEAEQLLERLGHRSTELHMFQL